MRIVGIVGLGSLGRSLVPMLKKKFIYTIGSTKESITDTHLSLNVDIVDNKRIARMSDVIILCVKPGNVKEVCDEIKGDISSDTIIISAAAAVPLYRILSWLPNGKVARCMPNVACGTGYGLVSYYTEDVKLRSIIHEIFCPNDIIKLSSDDEIDISTIIGGCGPALFSWYSKCLKNIDNTISKDKLDTMVRKTMLGTAHMLETYHEDEIIKMVASPGGVTETMLKNLDYKETGAYIQGATSAALLKISKLSSSLE